MPSAIWIKAFCCMKLLVEKAGILGYPYRPQVKAETSGTISVWKVMLHHRVTALCVNPSVISEHSSFIEADSAKQD